MSGWAHFFFHPVSIFFPDLLLQCIFVCRFASYVKIWYFFNFQPLFHSCCISHFWYRHCFFLRIVNKYQCRTHRVFFLISFLLFLFFFVFKTRLLIIEFFHVHLRKCLLNAYASENVDRLLGLHLRNVLLTHSTAPAWIKSPFARTSPWWHMFFIANRHHRAKRSRFPDGYQLDWT